MNKFVDSLFTNVYKKNRTYQKILSIFAKVSIIF